MSIKSKNFALKILIRILGWQGRARDFKVIPLRRSIERYMEYVIKDGNNPKNAFEFLKDDFNNSFYIPKTRNESYDISQFYDVSTYPGNKSKEIQLQFILELLNTRSVLTNSKEQVQLTMSFDEVAPQGASGGGERQSPFDDRFQGEPIFDDD